jgi:aminopeptidase N
MLLVFYSCRTTKHAALEPTELPEVTVLPAFEGYRASNTILNNVEHVKLDVRLDWTKKYLYGKEQLTARPHFYSTNTLILDARGMSINEVALLSVTGAKKILAYDYRHDSLTITLDRFYKSNESYTIFIDYIAKPDELKNISGSAAITSDKGLYFINADGKDADKPTQLWTQGETQSNSVWFPIIDSPNQKMTQEINITVDDKFETLSNGLLIASVKNADGTRTDKWKQSLKAAPYLTMMAISNFKIVQDKWRNMDVNYYVDQEFERYAKQIFGNTPEMLEFFSTALGVDYPWEKFSQVVVHDYVSGAMENTSAVLHGEFLQRTSRELLDATNEDVIAHELFHQWFGDLVTCESWSNIPLNESFATYGEYLWNEHKYGREEADNDLQADLNQYLSEAKYKQVDLIRFYYDTREDMFDRHSYAKGGRILHMLRKYVGDDAFFASLKKYLSDNKFGAVEAHHLRLAFEAVTGQDMNWFFNQWFFAKGHPEIEINYQWNDSLKKQLVVIEQKQNLAATPLYKLPLMVDLYENGTVRHEKIEVNKQKEIFFFDCSQKPDLINVDAEKQLLCSKKDNHTNEEWIYQYAHAPLFLDRYESISKLSKGYEGGSASAKTIVAALNDRHYAIRLLAIKNCAAAAKTDQSVKDKLRQLVLQDRKSAVRAEALVALHKQFDDTSLDSLALNDSSYLVMTTALESYITKNPKQLNMLKKYESETNNTIKSTIADLYAEFGDDDNYAYMKSALQKSSGFSRFTMIQIFGTFLERCTPQNLSDGATVLVETGKNATSKFTKNQTTNTLNKLNRYVSGKLKEYGDKPEYLNDVSIFKKLSEFINQAVQELKK